MTWLYVLIPLVPIVSYRLFRWAVGSMSLQSLNLVSFVYYFWLLFVCYLGSVMMLLGTQVYFLTGLAQEITSKVYLTISYVLLVLPIGIKLSAVVFNGSAFERLKSYYSKLGVSVKTYNYKFWIFCFILAVLAGIYTSAVVPKIPIFRALAGASETEILQYRFIAKFDFPGIIYIKNLFFHLLSVICSFVFFNIYLKNPRNYNYLVIAVLSITWAIYAESFNGEKAPIVFYIIALFLNYYILYRKRMGVKAIRLAIVAVAGIGLMYYLVQGEVKLSSYSGPLARTLFVPTSGMFFTYKTFPDELEFLDGASFPGWLVSKFGMEHKRSARAIMEHLNPDGVAMGTSGVINTLFISEAYANFGNIGLFMSPLIVGFIIGLIHHWIIKRPINFLNVALLVYFMLNIPVVGGFVDFIWNVSWFFIALIIFASRRIDFSAFTLRASKA